MRVLFACGGTGGHITPALAVAGYIKKRQPDAEILFAGSPLGMEAKLIPKEGYAFAPIKVKGFQRRLSVQNIKNNAMALVYLTTASRRAGRIINDFAPDVIFGTGGYVSGPILRQGAKMGYPALAHESNAYPGVTTKLLAKYVDKILISTTAAKKYLPAGTECVLTGNPVREEFFLADRQQVRREIKLEGKICVLSFGGSNGAKRVNEAIADLIAHNQDKKNIHHIHATGAFGTEFFPALLEKKGVDIPQNPNLDIREYIYDMPRCFAAADLVISRSGAMTISELQASGKASILIPSPNVAENHQYYNALSLAERGAAMVIEEKHLTGQWLCETFDRLAADPDRLKELGKNAAALAIPDVQERIYEEIRKATKNK